MKWIPSGFAILVLLLPGCTTPEFQPYHGRHAVTHGLGGTHSRQHGIDVWTNGAPPRPYRLLGTIEKVGAHRSNEEAVLRDCIETARRNGGDAIMVLESDTRVPGGYLRMAGSGYLARPHLRVAVLGYLRAGRN